MSLLYVNENNAYIGVEANRFFVKYSDGMKKMIPVETLENITIMGHAQMTTQCIQECLKRGIPVSYYSKGGSYFGRLQSTGHVNAKRQRQQCALYQSEFSLEISKRIIRAKLKNQIVVLQRYGKSKNIAVEDQLKIMRICREKVSKLWDMRDKAQKHILKGFPESLILNFHFMDEIKDLPGMNLIL